MSARVRRVAVFAFGALLLLTQGACSDFQVYGGPDTLNSGVVWTTSPGHCAGYEITGTPGFFADVDCN